MLKLLAVVTVGFNPVAESGPEHCSLCFTPWPGPKMPNSGSEFWAKGNYHSLAACLIRDARADLPGSLESATVSSCHPFPASYNGSLGVNGVWWLCDDTQSSQQCHRESNHLFYFLSEFPFCSLQTCIYDGETCHRNLTSLHNFSPMVGKSEHLPKNQVIREPSEVIGLWSRGFISGAPGALCAWSH